MSSVSSEVCRAAWCARARTSRIGICHNASPVSTISLTTRRGNSQHQQPTHDRPRCRSIIQHQRVHATSRLDFTPAPLVRRKTRGALCATFRQRGAANTAVAIEEVPPSASIQTSFIATWCSKDERGREICRGASRCPLTHARTSQRPSPPVPGGRSEELLENAAGGGLLGRERRRCRHRAQPRRPSGRHLWPRGGLV